MAKKTHSFVRAIRFSNNDIEDIDTFIQKNPMFDFSSLTRIAIRTFIENPKIDLTAISSSRIGKKSNFKMRDL